MAIGFGGGTVTIVGVRPRTMRLGSWNGLTGAAGDVGVGTGVGSWW